MRGPITPTVVDGEDVFESIGCADCHVSTLVTGPSTVAALDQVTFHPFSDFLLHDMKKGGDEIAQGDATGSEVRTAPLWGVRLQNRFLHDGSATNLTGAIEAHEGQAASSRRSFERLSDDDRAALLAFLRSL